MRYFGKIVHLKNSNFELSLGWSKESIDKGVEEMKLPKISSGIITNGPIDLVHYHYEKSNNLLGMTNIFCLLTFFVDFSRFVAQGAENSIMN